MTNPTVGGVWGAVRSKSDPGIDSYESPLDAIVYHSTRKASVDCIIRLAVGLLTYVRSRRLLHTTRFLLMVQRNTLPIHIGLFEF